MKETIILSNVNERELLKTLALNGVNIFNVRVFNSENLAKEALIRSGKIISSKQIRTIEQECFVYQLLGNISYFKYASFVDAKNIVRSLNYARKLCRKDEEKTISDVLSDGEFKEKNLALLKIYQEYKNYLKTNNLIDGLEIINYAIGNAKAIDGEFVVFKETPLEPLEQELIKVVSNNNYSIKTIREFANKQDKKLTNVTYANAYGAINEVEYILGYIAKNNIAYEDCVVALLDDSYLRHFINYQNNYNLPINLTTGQDLSLANSFKLLTLIDKWNKQYNATDSLNDLIQAMEFNINKFWENVCGDDDIKSREKKEIIKTVGNLRLSVYKDEKLNKYKESISDKKEKDRYKYVERFANELYNGYSYLINTYTNVDNELFENKAIKTICSYIDDYFKYLRSI